MESDAHNAAPWIVNIELTNACNLACVFCDHPAFTATGMKFREMRNEILEAALECYRGHTLHELGLVGLGEPTLAKRLPEYLARIDARADGFERISINSNLVSLTEKVAATLLASSINAYTFSLNASDRETYRRMMGRDRFDRALAHLNGFLAMRKAGGRDVAVSVQLFDSPRNDVEALRPLVPLWDDVQCFTRSVYSKPVVREDTPLLRLHRPRAPDRYPCWDIYTRLYVDVDGNVYPCTIGNDCHRADSRLCLGNLANELLPVIFNGETLRAARRAAERGGLSFPECKECNVWSLTPNNFRWDAAAVQWVRQEIQVRAHGLKTSATTPVPRVPPAFAGTLQDEKGRSQLGQCNTKGQS